MVINKDLIIEKQGELIQWVKDNFEVVSVCKDFEQIESELLSLQSVTPDKAEGETSFVENPDKVCFINKHRKLCDKAFWNGGDHKDYKTEAGRELIILARKELCYKDTTYAGDIFYILYKIYEGVVNGKSATMHDLLNDDSAREERK